MTPATVCPPAPSARGALASAPVEATVYGASLPRGARHAVSVALCGATQHPDHVTLAMRVDVVGGRMPRRGVPAVLALPLSELPTLLAALESATATLRGRG